MERDGWVQPGTTQGKNQVQSECPPGSQKCVLWLCLSRLCSAGPGPAVPGSAWLGSSRVGSTPLGSTPPGSARPGSAWLVSARLGSGIGLHGAARFSSARLGSAWLGSTIRFWRSVFLKVVLVWCFLFWFCFPGTKGLIVQAQVFKQITNLLQAHVLLFTFGFLFGAPAR